MKYKDMLGLVMDLPDFLFEKLFLCDKETARYFRWRRMTFNLSISLALCLFTVCDGVLHGLSILNSVTGVIFCFIFSGTAHWFFIRRRGFLYTLFLMEQLGNDIFSKDKKILTKMASWRVIRKRNEGIVNLVLSSPYTMEHLYELAKMIKIFHRSGLYTPVENRRGAANFLVVPD